MSNDGAAAVGAGKPWDVASVLAMAGADAVRRELPGALLALGTRVVVAVVESGDDPKRSGIRNRRAAGLVGDLQASSDRGVLEALHLGHRNARVFVRTAGGCLDLGRGSISGPRPNYGGRFREYSVDFRAPLDRELLDLLRPVGQVPEDLPGLGWLEAVGTDNRCAVEQFASQWFGISWPRKQDHDDVPAVLREVLAAAEFEPRILGGSGPFSLGRTRFPEPMPGVPLANFREREVEWSYEPGAADPRVLARYDAGGGGVEEERLAGFLLQSVLNAAAQSADYEAMFLLMPPQNLAQAVAPYAQVPLRPWISGYRPTTFHVAPGLVLMAMETELGDYDVFVGAKSRALLTRLAQYGDEYDLCDG